MLVVFDLDGTLACSAHRKHHLPDYEAWYEACVNDEPIQPAVTIARDCIKLGYRVEVWTARHELDRPNTTKWVNNHLGRLATIRMMADGTQTDAMFKLELAMRYRPDLVYENDLGCIRAYQKAGVFTCYVGRLIP